MLCRLYNRVAVGEDGGLEPPPLLGRLGASLQRSRLVAAGLRRRWYRLEVSMLAAKVNLGILRACPGRPFQHRHGQDTSPVCRRCHP